jgi:tetratricopeptide (TPR) repeat protein
MPWLLVGWLWYLGTLLPVIGLVQVGRQAMADRYSYIPHIGLFVMIAWTVAEFAARAQQARKMVVAGAVGLTIAFAVRAADQTQHWKNTTTLFDHALAVMPENPVALNQVGNARLREGDPAAAEVLYRRALALEPEYGMAHLNLGNLLARRREFDKAAEHFEAALRWRSDLARAHLGLAVARAGLKQYDLADTSFREALGLAPHLEEARRAWENARKEQAATRPAAATTRAVEDSSPAPIIRPSGQ